jgi:Alternative oxidase
VTDTPRKFAYLVFAMAFAVVMGCASTAKPEGTGEYVDDTVITAKVKTAHRVTGYFEVEAIHSDTEYLAGVENGTHANVPAPRIAIDYWKLAPEARLRDVIIAVRADEVHHRDVNHRLADELA